MDATTLDQRLERRIEHSSEAVNESTALTVPLPMPEQVQAAANAGDKAPAIATCPTAKPMKHSPWSMIGARGRIGDGDVTTFARE